MPVLSDFTLENAGSATADQTMADRIYAIDPAHNGADLRVWSIAAPATPYVITAAFLPFIDGGVSAPAYRWGLLFQDSGTNLAALVFQFDGGVHLRRRAAILHGLLDAERSIP